MQRQSLALLVCLLVGYSIDGRYGNRSFISIRSPSNSSNLNARGKRDGGATATIATAVIAGASLGSQTASQIAKSLGGSVGGAIEIENRSRYKLTEGVIYTDYGVYKEGPTEVRPFYKEAWQVEKSSWGTAGTSGIIRYKVRTGNHYSENLYLYIVWKAPWNHDFSSNSLAIGLYPWNDIQLDLWYNWFGYGRGTGCETPANGRDLPVCGFWKSETYDNGGRKIDLYSNWEYLMNSEKDDPACNNKWGNRCYVHKGSNPKIRVTGFMGSSHKFTINIKIIEYD